MFRSIFRSTSMCWILLSRRARVRRSREGSPRANCYAMLRMLTGMNLIGADVVEVAPAYDHAEITSIAAATVVFDLLCLMVANQ